MVALLLLVAAFVWAYWPTLVSLAAAWNREPDYSHGFLVPLLAIYFVWSRRDRMPQVAPSLCWLGLALTATSIGVRLFAAHYHYAAEALDGWSIMLWVAGAVWLLAGPSMLWWSLPSIAFLWFMVPLPYRAERWASLPLQTLATKLSCWTLQSLGQPALAEGHVILLGGSRLEVEQACSGLRIFVGILALAFAYVVLVRQSWWERGLLLAAAIPIAVAANVARIVTTGLLLQHISSDSAKTFTHDAAGWVMIIFAALLFSLVLWYVHTLVRETEVIEVGALLRRQRD